MKIVEPKQESKFEPVTVVFETLEELQLVVRLLGMCSGSDATKLGVSQGIEYDLFIVLSDKLDEIDPNSSSFDTPDMTLED